MLRVLASLLLLGTALAATPLSELREHFEYAEFERTNLAEPAYRLLDTIQPSAYYVDLDVYLSQRRFNGRVTIDVNINQNLQQIVLHSKVESITSVTVLDASGSQLTLNALNPLELDTYFEIIKINLANNATVGFYTIDIIYSGIINENQFDRGFYLGYYLVNGERRDYATTQFQPFHARKAFPCFDEPQFKSVFTIAITRDSWLSKSYSNMAIQDTQNLGNNRTREVFYPTPIIPAYLIAFHVSDFVETYYGTAGRPVGIVSRPGITSQHPFAGVNSVGITDWLGEYLSFDYYTHNPNGTMKNDHIALPDFPSGAMENWGMVNYREAYLLNDDAHTNIVYKMFMASIIAHELGHKWFGNLVTCFWWSSLWLNESFASYFEHFAAGPVNPSYEFEETFVVDYVQSALLYDSGAGALPMNDTAVSTQASISGSFGTHSYGKGASVLRTMEHFAGASTFRKALSYYLADNQYQLGTDSAMYAAFERAVAEDNALSIYPNTVSATSVFAQYANLPGAPMVNVDINYTTGLITVSQERFLISGAEASGSWHVPLTWTRAGDIDWDNTKPSTVLTTQSTTLTKPAGEEWVIFNKKQSGYYRVNYDDYSWQIIANALRNDGESIHYLSRSQIVNDVLNYVRAGRLSVTRTFDIISFLSQETNYYVWAGALTPLIWIRRRLVHLPEVQEEFDSYVLQQMDATINALGFDELTRDNPITQINRLTIMGQACSYGHEACINYSINAFQAWRANPNALIAPNQRSWVYCNGLRYGNYSDYAFLWQQYVQSENAADMVYILRSLACTKDETALRELLQRSLDSDYIRLHDRTNTFTYALQGNQENLPVVLDFLYNNYGAIREAYGGSARLITCLSNVATFMLEQQYIDQFETWLYANQLNLRDEFSTGVSVLASVRSARIWGNNFAPELRNYLRTNSASGMTVSITLLLSAALFNILKY